MKTLTDKIAKVFKIPYAVLMMCLNIVFLPEQVRQWFFGTGTRGLEILNAMLMLTWGVVSLLNKHTQALLPTYEKIGTMPALFISIIFFILGFAQLFYVAKSTINSNIASGFLLVVSGLVWSIVAVGYWGNYPPLTPGMVVYFPLAIVNWWAGVLIIDNAKLEKIDKNKLNQCKTHME